MYYFFNAKITVRSWECGHKLSESRYYFEFLRFDRMIARSKFGRIVENFSPNKLYSSQIRFSPKAEFKEIMAKDSRLKYCFSFFQLPTHYSSYAGHLFFYFKLQKIVASESTNA